MGGGAALLQITLAAGCLVEQAHIEVAAAQVHANSLSGGPVRVGGATVAFEEPAAHGELAVLVPVLVVEILDHIGNLDIHRRTPPSGLLFQFLQEAGATRADLIQLPLGFGGLSGLGCVFLDSGVFRRREVHGLLDGGHPGIEISHRLGQRFHLRLLLGGQRADLLDQSGTLLGQLLELVNL